MTGGWGAEHMAGGQSNGASSAQWQRGPQAMQDSHTASGRSSRRLDRSVGARWWLWGRGWGGARPEAHQRRFT